MKKTIKILSLLSACSSLAQGMMNEDNNNKDNKEHSGKEIVEKDKQVEENTEYIFVPKEILAEIFSFVDWKNTPKLRLVCKLFDAIIRDPIYEDINIAFLNKQT